ncbi:unnamed protein product [Adineta steineri]|uniref:LamG-like jellyroll fold domain-containing protein n=1 Tax=Adineta steineri TaxID=433720 RepID=A0A813XPR8_9BILA|nr:unnamed protein product [Adineta steineri]CAF3819333.1 unnamed protein product [Adineta steineri]CAF3840317.1 unnamed protein product [Adineta steineri]
MILSNDLIIGDQIKVGIVNNVSLNVPQWSTRSLFYPVLNGTCEECLCAVVTNSSALNSIVLNDIGSFNCFRNNQTCQFFSKSTFYQFWLSNDNDTDYYIFQLPTTLNESDLLAWHSFDNGSYNDSSGNQLNAIEVVDVSPAVGRINDAVNFSLNTSLYKIGGFIRLGQSEQPYSVALWVRPKILQEAPLVHLSAQSDGQGWCIDMLGFLVDGQTVARCWQLSPVIVSGLVLPIDVWTHVTTAYSPTIGLQIYINGTLINQSSPFSYSASDQNNYITLANSLSAQSGSACASSMIAQSGVFHGLIDELRVYTKALSQDDIDALANP